MNGSSLDIYVVRGLNPPPGIDLDYLTEELFAMRNELTRRIGMADVACLEMADVDVLMSAGTFVCKNKYRDVIVNRALFDQPKEDND